MSHTSFTTTTRGLDRNSMPMRLYEKAKRLGIWNPADIDFAQDRLDWAGFKDEERDLIWRLTAMFQAGEEAVTLDLLPLVQVIAREGRLEEEMFLTSFLFEEAKHTDFFRRFLDEVAVPPSPAGSGAGGERADLSKYHTANYHHIFYEALPQALQALSADPSPAAQVRASVTYNMVVEGVLAETGYHAFHTMLERNSLLPGLRKGIGLLKQDESRHIAYGIYLLSRLVSADPALWPVLEEHMNGLLAAAIGVIGDAFAAYQVVPFGLREDDFVGYAMDQFERRFQRLERARSASLADVEFDANQALDSGEA